MKKLINLLAGITLITTTTSNVIACDKTDQHGPSDQDQVNSIIAKMKKRHITVAAGSNTLVNNRDTMQQINKALQDLNALSASDVRAISYINPPILKAGKSVDVEASIKVGQYTKTILIHVTLAETIAQQVEAFQEKFNSSVVNTIAATPTKQGASETSTDINDYIVALQRSLLVNNPNPGVTDDDLAKIIAYGSPPLILGQVVNVTANFSFTNSIGQTIAGQLTFLVQRAQTPEEKARAIANKIITRSFDVDASTTESQVQTKLQTALRSANNTLTDADVNKFV